MSSLGYQGRGEEKKNRSGCYIGSLTPGMVYEWDEIPVDVQCNVGWVLLSEALVIACDWYQVASALPAVCEMTNHTRIWPRYLALVDLVYTQYGVRVLSHMECHHICR